MQISLQYGKINKENKTNVTNLRAGGGPRLGGRIQDPRTVRTCGSSRVWRDVLDDRLT